jgi:hypothetical protein
MLVLLACMRIPEQTLTRPFYPYNTRSPNMLRRMIVSSAHSIWQLHSAIILYVAGSTNLVISRVFLSSFGMYRFTVFAVLVCYASIVAVLSMDLCCVKAKEVLSISMAVLPRSRPLEL